MTATELKPCPFCGGEATAVPDASHSTAWEVGCFSRFCAVEPNVWAAHKSTAQLQWNARVDINQAAISRAEQAEARVAELEVALRDMVEGYQEYDLSNGKPVLQPIEKQSSWIQRARAALSRKEPKP